MHKRKLIFVLIIFFVWQIKAQDKVYLYFDNESNELCDIPKAQQGRYHGKNTVKKYRKIVTPSSSSSDTFNFYICNELFIFNQGTVQHCNIDYLEKIKFSEIKSLINIVNKTNPLYPSQVFEKVYIVEKINDSKIALYDVKWQYYVE